MLQQDEPGDYVIATGEQHSVREFCERAFAEAGITLRFEGAGGDELGVVDCVDPELLARARNGYGSAIADEALAPGSVLVRVDKRYFRPTEVGSLIGDASKARRVLGLGARDRLRPPRPRDGLGRPRRRPARRALPHAGVRGAGVPGVVPQRVVTPRVVIFYKSIAQYRLPFYDLLRKRLAADGIDLEVVYGAPVSYEVARRDRVDLPWGHKTRIRAIRIGSRELYWQPGLSSVRRGDLVVVEQASKLLLNYVLFALHRVGFIRLALWGHGRTIRARRSSSVGEALKTFISRRVSWWFAYNERSAAFVRQIGFPDERITRLQNAIDTKALIAAAAAVTPEALDAVRRDLGLTGRHVGIYVGAMYEDKRLPFLLEACLAIRERVPDFEMIFVGDGPDAALVRDAAACNDWMHYVGPKFDDNRIAYMMLAGISLMPGGVGLGVLDSFALGVPLITTAVPSHGPEIEYLEDGVNGLIVKDDSTPRAFGDAVAATIQDETLLATLREGCRQARERYTIEEMVERFAYGARRALGVATRPARG